VKITNLLSMVALLAVMLFSSAASARHINIFYVDADRPPEYALADVLAGIQRAMREWEAHNGDHSFVLHWGGIIGLEAAPENYNNIVIRWANTDYSGSTTTGQPIGRTCRWPSGCAGSPPTPTYHIFLMSFWDGWQNVPPTGRWNNPRFVPFSGNFGTAFNQDMVGTLVHEFAHLFRDEDEIGPTSVLNVFTGFPNRYLWNQDIFGVDLSLHGWHNQALQLFAINDSNGAVSALFHMVPTFPVHSPASLSVGDGVQGSGDYVVAYNTFDSSTQSDALLVRFTDRLANGVDRVIHATLNGVDVGSTLHRPCVAVSAAGTDYYLVWASPAEGGGGWRQVLSMESHGNRGTSWSTPEVIQNAFTRTGVSCSIDRATERLVVAYTGAGEDGLWLTHRPSLTAGSGQWSAPKRVLDPPISGDQPNISHLPSTYGPPDVVFDFFSTSTQGFLSWQDNADLLVHSISITFSGGLYVIGATNATHLVDRSLLRSWPVVSFEGAPFMGSSIFVGNNHGEERRSFPGYSSIFSTESYTVGAVHAARRYTGAASNRVLWERAFLSTANTGITP